MKRRWMILIVVALCIALCVVICGCNKQKQEEQKDNISRQTNAYYAGEGKSFAAFVEVGRREKNFIADGKVTDVEDFALICVTPLVTNDFESIDVVLAGQDATLSLKLTKSANGEFCKDIVLDFVPTSVSLCANDVSEEIALADVLQGALSAQDIVNIAKDAFKERIQKEQQEGKAEREIYVKLITPNRADYFYYVSFIGEGVDYWAMLINPQNGQIITQK